MSTKETCKECKFIKCHAVGMNPDKILGTKEKAKYVKKSLRTKNKELVMTTFDTLKDKFCLDEDIEMSLAYGISTRIHWSKRHTEEFMMSFRLQCNHLLCTLSKLDFWQDICKADQDLLIHFNLDLYRQYLMAAFFMSSSVMSQLDWLLAHRAPKFYGK